MPKAALWKTTFPCWLLVAFHLSAFDLFVVGAYNGSAEWSFPSFSYIPFWVGLGFLGGWLIVFAVLAVVSLTFADCGLVLGVYYNTSYEGIVPMNWIRRLDYSVLDRGRHRRMQLVYLNLLDLQKKKII